MRVVLTALSLLSFALTACGGCGRDEAPPNAPVSDEAIDENLMLSFVDALPSCDVDHRGLLIDLGPTTLPGRLASGLSIPNGIVTSEPHDGASWVRVYDRTLDLSFFLPQASPLFVALRLVGEDASRITVSLDGYGLGTLKIGHDEAKIVSTKTTSLPVDAGLHTLSLRFRDRKTSDSAPYAEIDWVRIALPDELQRTYGAPTLDDVLAPSAQLAGVPHRALSLRAPGSVRCTVRVPAQGRLRTAVGMNGEGQATAAVVVHRDGEDAATLHRVDVAGGPDATWTDVDLSLNDLASQIVTVELSALKTTGTGRLMFGDPAVFAPPRRAPKTPSARAAVVVVLDGVERDDLPPWRQTETPHLPTLNALAKTTTVFHQQRAPSTLVAAVVASLLSGLSPSVHTLSDVGARLPTGVRTLGEIARDGSVRAAMFSGVPTTFEPFGFAAQWDKFTQYPPNEGRLASAPMDDASAWLADGINADGEGRPLLAVLHARGGHPPWEVKPDEAERLPPADYTGYFSARRAAQILAKLQGRHSRLSEQDTERMRALFHAGLSRQDEALGKLIRRLEDLGIWDTTLFIVVGDVASGRRQLFQDGLDLDESILTVPLYVHFPGGALAGASVNQATEIYDVTQTLLASLGLKAPPDMLGRDLFTLASGGEDADRIRAAITADAYSVRWGDYALHGKFDETPALCDLLADPTCAYDRRDRYPLVTQALYRRFARIASSRPPAAEREPLTLDAEAAAMLEVWGVY